MGVTEKRNRYLLSSQSSFKLHQYQVILLTILGETVVQVAFIRNNLVLITVYKETDCTEQK